MPRVELLNKQDEREPVGGHPLFPKRSWDRVAVALDLSAQDVEIACRIFRDQSEETIAARLGASARAVHDGVVRLYRKLRVHGRVQLVVRLAREHLSGDRQTAEIRELGPGADEDEEYPLFGAESWREVARSLNLSPRHVQVACATFRDELARKTHSRPAELRPAELLRENSSQTSMAAKLPAWVLVERGSR